MKTDKAKMGKKQIATAVAIALAVVIPWMVFGGDLGTAIAQMRVFDDPNGVWGPYSVEGSCWWNFICLGHCNCS